MNGTHSSPKITGHAKTVGHPVVGRTKVTRSGLGWKWLQMSDPPVSLLPATSPISLPPRRSILETSRWQERERVSERASLERALRE